MKIRIAIWATAGVLVVIFWTAFVSATFDNPLAAGGIARTLVYLTCPISLAHRYAMNFNFVVLVNAATYALVGAAVEGLRRPSQKLSVSN